MIRIKVKLGKKGQIVIPKVIRESLGLVEDKFVMMEVKDKKLEIFPVRETIPAEWEKIAEKEGTDVEKNMIYGDKLYEEVF